MKKYEKFIDTSIKCADVKSDYVFTCWFQGEEYAPDLVRTCINSMRLHFPDKRLVVITSDNFRNYTDIPQYIIDKWQRGIITHTHFSDILRADLLSRHGGLWLDATVLCMGDLNRYVHDNSPFFAFKTDHRGNYTECLSSWLIYSRPNHPFMVNTRNMLYEYWKVNNKLKDYYLFHVFFTACSQIMNDLWQEVPFYSNINPHVMQFHYLFQPFNQMSLDKLKEISAFHKLTYKVDGKDVSDGTLFAHISRGDLSL